MCVCVCGFELQGRTFNLTERYGSPVYITGKCITGYAASSDRRAHVYVAWR